MTRVGGAARWAGWRALAYGATPDAPPYVGESGRVAVAVAFTAGLVARTGGRTFVYGALALLLGAAVVVTDEPVLRTGAAVLTCVVTAVFAVMVTVPAVTVLQAAREVVVAMLVAVVGAAAVVGLEPTLNLARFAYTTLGGSLGAVPPRGLPARRRAPRPGPAWSASRC